MSNPRRSSSATLTHRPDATRPAVPVAGSPRLRPARSHPLQWLAACALLIAASTTALGAGEPVNGFPNWEERVLLQWINRARVDPQADLASCANATCAEKACYGPKPPLPYSLAVGRAARFHSQEMPRQGFFAHDSVCALVSNLSALYPDACDGSASCACQAPNPPSTWSQRIARFGASASGEIIAAGSTDPQTMFYLWLHEPDANPACGFRTANGHRWLILEASSAAGPGQPRGIPYSTVDFGSGGTLTRIPSGSHYPRSGNSVGLWANWNDAAAPTEAFAQIDGVQHALTLQRGTAANGAYAATVTGLASGCHRYHFRFRDAAGDLVRHPARGTLGIGDANCPDWAQPATRDFNLDARSDILWRNQVSGEVVLWTMNGASATSTAPVGGSLDWTVAATGDFDGDGRADIVWRHTQGASVVWLMNGSTVVRSAILGSDPNWRVVAAADLDNDGRSDLIWRSGSGLTVVWFMNATSPSGSAVLGSDPDWSMAFTGDFNGDGLTDIIWRSVASGTHVVWLMNGTAILSARTLSAGNAWRLEAVGDFDGDGRTDLVWRHSADGTAVQWLLDADARVRQSTVLSGPTPWRIVSAADLTGDGRSDLLWAFGGTTFVLHAMNGGSVVASSPVAVSTDWQPVP